MLDFEIKAYEKRDFDDCVRWNGKSERIQIRYYVIVYAEIENQSVYKWDFMWLYTPKLKI